MDNLIKPSAMLESLQKKAGIISAFCIIFGVDISIYKLNLYIANWSLVNILSKPTL